MKLLSLLQSRAADEESYFRKALLGEDIARLGVLMERAKAAPDLAHLMKEGLYIGWTKGDLRTGELTQVLRPLMAAVFALQHGQSDAQSEQEAIDCWIAFAKARMEILIHCL